MPRIMSEANRIRVMEFHKADPDAIGPELGDVILKTNVPIAAVAQLLRTTEATIHRWMYGETEPRAVYHPSIRKLIILLRRALRAHDAPLTGSHAQRMEAMPNLIVTHKAKPSRGID